MKSIGVIGGGAWGTALAQAQADGGHPCTLWARETEVVQAINSSNENTVFLKGIPLSPALKATNDLADITKSNVILLVAPAQYTRACVEDLKPYLPAETPLVICSKGIEIETGLMLSDVIKEILPKQPVAVMTGPTFASEIARGLPSAVTIAAESEHLAKDLQEAIGLRRFRPYISTDMIGAQLGGSLKNVIAIAAGIVAGKNMGDSARAALITRGLAEIVRLCVAKGGKRETLLGMCGVGDLMLTCSSMQSRNYSLGFALGEGKTLADIMAGRNSVTEGVYTAQAALKMAKKNAVDLPITEAVYACLHDGMPIEKAMEDMLNRPFKY